MHPHDVALAKLFAHRLATGVEAVVAAEGAVPVAVRIETHRSLQVSPLRSDTQSNTPCWSEVLHGNLKVKRPLGNTLCGTHLQNVNKLRDLLEKISTLKSERVCTLPRTVRYPRRPVATFGSFSNMPAATSTHDSRTGPLRSASTSAVSFRSVGMTRTNSGEADGVCADSLASILNK